ncbi:signal peptidase I [Microbacterium sp. NPDC055357]
MQALRRVTMVALWALAVVGVASGVVWGATAAGMIKPLIVISGSMEPEIMTGDLLIATKKPVADLGVGDVVSLPSELTSTLVTHRIVEITAEGDGSVITMKGDANEFEDALDYRVAGEVWMPQMQVPGAGAVIARISTPAVAVPLLIGLVALLGLTWLIPAPESRGTRKAGDSGALLPEVAR